MGVIQVLHNAVGRVGVGCQIARKKRYKVQRYYHYEGVGGCQIKKKSMCNTRMASMLTGEHNKGNISMHIELWA